MSQVTEVDFSCCGLGPVEGVHIIIKVLVASISLSGNLITGSWKSSHHYWYDPFKSGTWEYDLDLSGLTALSEAIATSKTLTSIDFSQWTRSSRAERDRNVGDYYEFGHAPRGCHSRRE